jgi:hypothetical protein
MAATPPVTPVVPPVTPVVPHEDPNTSSDTTYSDPAADGGYLIDTEDISTPYISSWYVEETITQVPKDSVGWLVSQGWQIKNITYDAIALPPIPYYEMTRNVLQNELILQSLLNEYTFAYNTAQNINDMRYNRIVRDWDAMLTSTQLQFTEEVSAQNAHAAVYLGDLEFHMDAVKTLIEDNQSDLATDAGKATTALEAMETKLTDLEDNYNANWTIIDGLLSDQADYLADFLSQFILELAKLDTNYQAHLLLLETQITAAGTDIAAVKTVVDAQVALLASDYDTYSGASGTLEDLLVLAGANLSTIATDIDTVLTDISSDYDDVALEITDLMAEGQTALTTHTGDYNAVLGALETDYDLHAGAATAFLDDLGATDLARIKEEFATSLATQLQRLTDNGLYSSLAAAAIERNTRDRDEQIQMLNDRLMREHFENQHRLYGQQTAMRQGTMAGKERMHGLQQELWRYEATQITGLHALQQSVRDRSMAGKQALYALRDANSRLKIEVQNTLYAAGQDMRRGLIEQAGRLQQLQQAVTQYTSGQRDKLLEQIQSVVTQDMAGLDRQHALQQTISGAAMAARNTLLQQLQDAEKGFMTGKERYAALTMQNASTLAEHRHKMIVERMNEVMTRQDGAQKKHDEDMKLMAYQLDTRNQLLIGFYGFVERREDVGPSIEDLARIATSLGDSSSGWIQP